MQRRKQPESPLETLTNHSNSLPDFPVLDSPFGQEDSKDLEVVQLIPEKVPDGGNKKQHDFFEVRCLKKAPDVSKKKRRGYPIIELPIVLLVLAVLGILGAIALPSLTSCGNKAKHSEAKNNIGALNRAQQAYHLDYKTFTSSLTDLGVGITPESENYSYSVRTTNQAAFNYAISRKGNIRSYVGGVFTIPATNLESKADKTEMITVAIACEAIHPGTTQPAKPTLQNGVLRCGSDTRDLSQPLRKD